MRKRIFKKRMMASLLITLVLLIGSALTVFAADLPFSDVPKGSWYYNDVETAYNTGLINGISSTSYAPTKNITYAEVIKLAACMYQKSYEGAVTLTPGSPWYQTFVDYAKANGIIDKDYSWNENATRAGYMEIFAKALKDADLAATNSVADNSIPDVAMNHPASKSIYQLYRAGILTGSDDAHSCKPDTMITRAEVAAILTRMMQKEKRLSFAMGEPGALTIVSQPQDAAVTAGEFAKFSVTAIGGKAPYTYEWHSIYNHFDFPVTIQPGVSYTENGGSVFVRKTETDIEYRLQLYYCIITDSEGNKVTSDSAVLSASGDTNNVTFIKHPSDYAFSPGQTASFSAKVTGGTAPYEYLWCINGAFPLEFDCTEENFYPVPDQAKIISAWVQCSAGDSYGRVSYPWSNLALLSAKNPASTLAITGQPQDIVTTEYGDVKFNIQVSGGSAPYKYSWHIIGSNSMTVKLPKGKFFGNGSFYTDQNTGSFSFTLYDMPDLLAGGTEKISAVYCEVEDSDGYVTVSRLAKITIGDPTTPLKITKQPKDLTVSLDDTAKLSVSVSGGKAPYTYTWHSIYDDFDTDISRIGTFTDGGRVFVLNTEAVLPPGLQQYYCVITDSLGQKVTTNKVNLVVTDDTLITPLTITGEPEDIDAEAGTTVRFSVEASGGKAPYTYQWYFFEPTGASIPVRPYGNKSLENSGATLVIKTDEGMADDYQEYYCIVTDNAGNSVTSNHVTLAVYNPSPIPGTIR